MKKLAIMGGNVNEVNGAIKVTVNLTNELSSYFDTWLITPNETESYFPLKDGVKRFSYRRNDERSRYTLLAGCLRLHNFLSNNKIDVLYIIDIGAKPIVGYLATIGVRNIKIIYAEHLTLYKNKFRKYNVFRKISQKLINRYSDKIVTLTFKEMNNYINFYDLKRIKVDYIYNYLDDNIFTPDIEYIGKNKKIITVGRIDFQKGYEYLVEVAKVILNKYKDLEWHIYGDLPRNGDYEYKELIINKIKEYGLNGRLILKGNRKDIINLYKDYDIYVSTSRYEGLPLTLIEAKSKRLPLVSFDIYSGPSDIIRDNIDGYLIRPFEIDSMINKIEYLISNSDVRKKMSLKSYENMGKFRKDYIIKQWVDLINSI